MPITATASVDVSKLDKFVADTHKFEAGLLRDLMWAALEVSRRGRTEARNQVPVFMGQLYNSIRLMRPVLHVDDDGFIIRAGVQAGEGLGVYPHAMEHGRTAGAPPPPIDVMEDYIRIKVAQGQFDISQYRGSEESRIRAAAFKLARHIGEFGTRGHSYMQAAAGVMDEDIIPIMDAVLEKHARDLERG